MADTKDVVASDAPDGEVTKPAPGIEEAGKVLKQTATWADVIKQSDEKPSEEPTPEPDKFEGFTVGEDDTLVRPDGTPGYSTFPGA